MVSENETQGQESQGCMHISAFDENEQLDETFSLETQQAADDECQKFSHGYKKIKDLTSIQ